MYGDRIHTDVWRDVFICVTWLICMWDMTHVNRYTTVVRANRRGSWWVCVCCSALQSYVVRGNGRGLWWMCVCCSVLQSYVAVCCIHVLFEETEEGFDECVCVAVCCSHMLQCVAVMCCSWKRKRVVMNVCVLQRVAVICCSVLQSYVIRGNGRGL